MIYGREPGRRSRPPRSRPPGPASRARPTSAASASASSGTWAGCTTRSATSQQDPIYRRYHHHELTFSLIYAFTRELHPAALPRRGRARQGLAATRRCPATAGRSSRTCARCTPTCGPTPARSCCSWAASSPRSSEWSHERSLDWHLLEQPEHAGIQALVRDLNRAYRDEPALWELDFDPAGFCWLEPNDADANVLAFARRSARRRRACSCASRNFSPVPRYGYRVGLPRAGRWRELLNTDSSLLRRLRRRQPRRRRGRAGPVARPAVLGRADAAAARRRSGWFRNRVSEPLSVGAAARGAAARRRHAPSSASGRRARSRAASLGRHRLAPARSRWRRRVRDLRGGRRGPAGDDYWYRARRPAAARPVLALAAEGLRGPSRVLDVDPGAALGDAPPLAELVIYELHVGTFSAEGTFERPRSRIWPSSRELGVTAIEIMPVAEFPGARGWGYDGVYISARRSPAYGGPSGLPALVDAAHERARRDPRRRLQPRRRLGRQGAGRVRPVLHRRSTRPPGARRSTTTTPSATRCASGCCRAPRAGSATSASTGCASTRSTRSSTRAPSTSSPRSPDGCTRSAPTRS